MAIDIETDGSGICQNGYGVEGVGMGAGRMLPARLAIKRLVLF